MFSLQHDHCTSTDLFVCVQPNGDALPITLHRSFDERMEKVDMSSPFRALGVDNALRVFGALLLERQILFCSSKLRSLLFTLLFGMVLREPITIFSNTDRSLVGKLLVLSEQDYR